MKNLIEKLQNVQTFSESLDKVDLDTLAAQIASEFDCDEQIENTLLFFFSLNRTDLEYVLEKVRRLSINQLDDKDPGKKFLTKNEKEIAKMVVQLNDHSISKYGVPFHLSAAKGIFENQESTISRINLNVKELVDGKNSNPVSTLRADCNTGNYPRYIPNMAPWRLRLSFSTRTMQRVQDVGCHFEHGPFNGTIRGWVTFDTRVIIMVLLQGWGFNLAANNNHFFYKWWFVIAAGLTPYSCHYSLYARVY